MNNDAEYTYIIVESFRPDNVSGHHGDVHIRPIKNQKYPVTLFIECSKELSNTDIYPLGSKFRIKVKLTSRKGTPFLYSYHNWPFEVVV